MLYTQWRKFISIQIIPIAYLERERNREKSNNEWAGKQAYIGSVSSKTFAATSAAHGRKLKTRAESPTPLQALQRGNTEPLLNDST